MYVCTLIDYRILALIANVPRSLSTEQLQRSQTTRQTSGWKPSSFSYICSNLLIASFVDQRKKTLQFKYLTIFTFTRYQNNYYHK